MDVLLFLILENDFQPSIIHCDIGCRTAIYTAYTLLRYIPSVPNSLEVLVLSRFSSLQVINVPAAA